MAYSYDPIFAVDPNSPSNVARNASILIFDPNDPAKAPVTLTDVTGSPVANPITVNQHGFGPAIKHATLDRLAWEGAGMSGVFTSYEGMKEEAVAAREAAEVAAADAAAAAQADLEARIASGVFKGEKGADGANVLPTDAAIRDAIENPGSAARGALNALTLASDNKNLAAYGDSLTEPGQWIAELVARQAVSVYNGGKSGQSSTEIAMRQGGLVPKVTVTGGVIPASGPVAVTVDYPTGAFKKGVNGAMANPEYFGTIAGVHGRLEANIQGDPRTWSFTRTTDGTAVSAPGQRWFASTEGPAQIRKEQIFWTGRNFSYDLVITDTAAMVANLRKHIANPSFTVVSVINGSSEPLGSSAYNDLIARNALLKETYGEHYCEVRRPLIDSGLAWAGITPTTGDQEDIANDIVPRSLTVGDGFHLNTKGQQFVGKLIAEHRTRLGYDRTGAILAANIGADPVYVPPYTPPAVTVSSGLVRRYVPQSLGDSKLNTKITALANEYPIAGVDDVLKPVVSNSGGTYRKAGNMAFLEFDGVGDRMYSLAFSQPQPFSAAIVYKLRSTGATKAILSLSNGTPSSPILRRESTGAVTFSAGVARTVTPATDLGTGWHIAYVSVNGASSIIGIDGTTITADPGANSIGGLRIGQGPTDYSDIDIAEILLWNRALTAGELESVRTDMKASHSALP